MARIVFTGQTYFDAAQLFLEDAGRLIRNAEYRWAHYIAGVAVECILRAHGMQEEDFTGRHDLMDLAEKSGFLNLPRDAKYDEYRSWLNELNLRWRSNQRFMTTAQLERYLKNAQFDRNVQGDLIKHSSNQVYSLALRVVGFGVLKYDSGAKNPAGA